MQRCYANKSNNSLVKVTLASSELVKAYEKDLLARPHFLIALHLLCQLFQFSARPRSLEDVKKKTI